MSEVERPSVCPVDRQQRRRRPAGLLLSTTLLADIDRQLRAPCIGRRRSAANADSVTLTVDAGD